MRGGSYASCQDLYISFFALDQPAAPGLDRSPSHLNASTRYQSRSRSNSGSDGFFGRDNGVTHEVRVLDRSVLYKRKRYRSLTEVAKLITGAHWNGPQFFGLRSRQEQEASHGSK